MMTIIHYVISEEGDSATCWLPDLAEYLIVNAPFLFEPFKDVQLAISSSVSNDSGLCIIIEAGQIQ